MDNQMIHIDELVRKRLGGAEERQKPGAWTAMRELLDKELPSDKLLAPFPWGRITGGLLLLLLTGALSVTGYRMFTNGRQAEEPSQLVASTGNAPFATHRSVAALRQELDNTSNINTNNTGTNPVSATSTSEASNSSNTNSPGQHENRMAAAGAKDHAQSNVTGGNHHLNHLNKTAGPLNAVPVQVPNDAPDRNNEQASSSAKSSNSGTTDLSAPAKTSSNSSGLTASAAKTSIPEKSSANSDAADWKNTIHPAEKASNPRPEPAAMRTPNSAPNAGALKAEKPAGPNVKGRRNDRNTNSQPPLLASGNNTNIARSKLYDTIPSIVRRERLEKKNGTNAVQLKLDTVEKGTAVVPRIEPAPLPAPAPSVASTTAKKRVVLPEPFDEIVPAASAKSNASALAKNATSGMEMLARKRVAVDQRNNWNIRSFQDWMRSMKFQLSQVHMYPGMEAGLNTAPFGDVSMSGFHVGLTALFVINEEWSFFSELRYTRKMSGSAIIADDYTQCSPYSSTAANLGGVATTIYNWSEDSVNHYYNVAGLHYVDLPLALRYHLKRYFFMAGLNFTYAFPVNVEEKEYQMTTSQARSYSTPSAYASGFVPGYDVRRQSIFTTDFASRFGMGYQLGGGYQLSPAVHVDLRLNQLFWDNAKTSGAKKVSELLFRQPNLQLTVGYRFGQKP